jgi:hypothetical protein
MDYQCGFGQNFATIAVFVLLRTGIRIQFLEKLCAGTGHGVRDGHHIQRSMYGNLCHNNMSFNKKIKYTEILFGMKQKSIYVKHTRKINFKIDMNGF